MEYDTIVYVVDPDEAIGEALTALLATFGIAVRTFVDAESFLAVYLSEDADPFVHKGRGCLLVEAELPGESGLSLVQRLHAVAAQLPTIVLTTIANDELYELRKQALSLGAADVLEKPLLCSFLIERWSELLPDVAKSTDASRVGVTLRDGTSVTFRKMRPRDAELEQNFVRGLSASSRRNRFFSSVNELSPALLHEFTHPQYPENYALVATVSEDGAERQVAVARYAPAMAEGVVEFALVVADDCQRLGIGSQLLRGLTSAAVIAGARRMEGLVLSDNRPMLHLTRGAGFKTSKVPGDASVLRVSKDF